VDTGDRPDRFESVKPAPNGLERKFLRIRRELHFWTRSTKVLLILVILLCVGGMAFGEYGLVRIVEVKKDRHHLEAAIITAKMNQCLLQDEKAKLASDPFTLEKLARERCGFCKPGELIFVFPEDSAATTSALTRINQASLDKLSLGQ